MAIQAQGPDMKRPLISIRNVSLSYGNFQALTDVSVDFHQGEMVGLVGDNGAGKTTLIRIISGIMPPTSGEVYFDGEKITKFHPKKAIDLGLECIQQTIGICDNLSVGRNYFLGREPTKRFLGLPFLDKKKIREASAKVIHDFGLRDTIDVDDEISLLSGGEKQTFKIARAVTFRNRVIIMDEPTNHLSVRERARVNELAVQLKQQGLLVIYITHDIFQIHRIADRIVVLENWSKGCGCCSRCDECRSFGGNHPGGRRSRSCEKCESFMRQRLRRIVRRHPEAATVSMVVLISLAFAIITRGSWLSVGNLQVLSQITAVLAIMAFGQALVIATGEIDISVGSVCGVGALVFLGLAPVVGSALALLGALACGILIGALNGVFIALLGVPSLLVTLGTLFLFQGVAYAVTAGFSFVATKGVRLEFVYSAVGGGGFGGINVAIVWALIILVALQLVVYETPVGNRILAIGGDAASSFSRGVKVGKIKLGVFVVSGLLAAFAGVLDAAFIGYADGSFGATMELSAIAAAVLGGCHLAGGRISLIGTLLGAFMLRGIQSFLILLGVQPQWYILVAGLIVVLASLADRTLTSLALKK